MDYIPKDGDQLVDALDELYPARLPKTNQTTAEIFYAAGQRSVVELLRNIQNQDEDTK
jgi:hypothetical protein